MGNFNEKQLEELAYTSKKLVELLEGMAVEKKTKGNAQYNNNVAMREANGMLVDVITKMLCDKSLAPEVRVAMVLKYICGKSDKEIEAETGCSLKNVSPTSFDLTFEEEETYEECLKELQKILQEHNGMKYVSSQEFKGVCENSGVSNYNKFRQWLFDKGYIKGRRAGKKLTTSYVVRLGDEHRRCAIFL